MGEDIQLLIKEAKRGDPLAQFRVGLAYSIGKSVPQDHTESVKWYRKAAEQGEFMSQAALARAYFKGQGIPQDYLLSYFWISLATSRVTGKTHESGAEFREQAAKMLPHEQLMKAQQMTREWEAKHPRK